MSLKDFLETEVATPLGPVRLWATPPIADTVRPLVFAIPGLLSSLDDLALNLENLGLSADAVMMRLPSGREAALSDLSFPALSAMVAELLETRYGDRRVVLLGVSSGAAIALGVRAANLVRVVAAEPLLVTGDLWPIAQTLPAHLRELADPVASAFAFEALGIGPERSERRSHLAALEGLGVPVDVVLGGEPLLPPRRVQRLPSLVNEAVRRRLAATPGVRLHVFDGAGHNVMRQGGQPAHEVLLEACRRAATPRSADRLRVDEPLLEAVPLTARRVRYVGADGPAFRDALTSRNPQAEITCTETAGPEHDLLAEAFDAAVFAHPPSDDELAWSASALAVDGNLISRWPLPDADAGSRLRAHGLSLREPVDTGGTGIICAQKLPAGCAPRPAMLVHTIAYAWRLMDVRTRLPVQGLRADPDLQVTFQIPPLKLPPADRDTPKVLVLARLGEMSVADWWRPFLAQLIRDGWPVVQEYDDFPPLVAEALGAESGPDEMRRFGCSHGVQTSTPPLVEAFQPFNPETVMFPNAVFELLPFPTGPRPKRVFYGGVTRGPYAVQVAQSLAPAVSAYPETEFVVIGDREVFEALPTASKRFYDYMSFEAYLDLMSQCTISLSPVEAGPMRDAKSDAKFLDASRAGTLTIASPTVYERVIEDGVNGLLARDVDDWSPLLKRALADDADRERMAKAAWAYVRAERMFAHQAAQRRDWYLSLWDRREALNAALMDRVPGLRETLSA